MAGRDGERRPLVLATAGVGLQDAELELPADALLDEETSMGALFEAVHLPGRDSHSGRPQIFRLIVLKCRGNGRRDQAEHSHHTCE